MRGRWGSSQARVVTLQERVLDALDSEVMRDVWTQISYYENVRLVERWRANAWPSGFSIDYASVEDNARPMFVVDPDTYRRYQALFAPRVLGPAHAKPKPKPEPAVEEENVVTPEKIHANFMQGLAQPKWGKRRR